jgi:D-glycero-D-manno-heptose 1,7-bisphosphate phosphatase
MQSDRPATIAQCVILADALATPSDRIAPGTPRAALPIGPRPFIAWLMREWLRFGVEEFIVLTAPLPPGIEDYLRNAAEGLPRPVSLTFRAHPKGAGLATSLRQISGELHPTFLLCNGESLLDANMAHLLADAARDDDTVQARLAVHEIADAVGQRVVTLEGDRVTTLAPGGTAGLAYAGIAVLRRTALDAANDTDLLPALAASGQLHATTLSGRTITTATPDALAHARRELPAILNRPALILDRDGVLNHDHGYVGSREKWDWVTGAQDAVALATNHGWHVFVATNQSGIARGLYTEADAKSLLAWMADALRRHGGTIDDVRFCPTHPEATLPAYRRRDDWRKPGPGMILNLISAWELTPRHCILIGDQDTDLQAAAAAGIAGQLFNGADLCETVSSIVLRGHDALQTDDN